MGLLGYEDVLPEGWLGDVDVGKAEGIKQGGEGGAGVFAGGVEDTVGEGGLLELALGFGAGVGFEVAVDGNEQAGGAGINAGVGVVEGGDEDFRGGKDEMDGAIGGAVWVFDADVFGFEFGQVDAGDGLAVDDEEDAIGGEDVGEDGAGFVAFDDGVERVDDGFEAIEGLDVVDDGGDGLIEGGGARGDEGGQARGEAGGGVMEEKREGGGAEQEGEQEGKERGGGAAAGVVLGGHGEIVCVVWQSACHGQALLLPANATWLAEAGENVKLPANESERHGPGSKNAGGCVGRL